MSLADQVPVVSPFDRDSTGMEVLEGIDLTGKTAIVTGGYSGIGLETTKALHSKGAKVIVPVRDMAKAKETLSGVNNVKIEVMDLADIASVRSFAARMLSELDELHLLINNAGIMATPLHRVGPGWEGQFGVNHMGHFVLTTSLLPLIQKSAKPRVIQLTSGGHRLSHVHFEDINYEQREYDKWQAYGQSKTANALFANALSRRLRATGGLAFSVHPGGILTPLQRHLPTEEMVALGWINEDGTQSEQVRKGPEPTIPLRTSIQLNRCCICMLYSMLAVQHFDECLRMASDRG